MFKKLSFLFVLSCFLLIMVACNQANDGNEEENASQEEPTEETENQETASEEEIIKAKFILDWVPNTNHTGIYVAQEKGFFAEEGIELEIIEPALEGASQIVASGQAHFGISSQNEVTMARSNDIPVVSIAAVIQEHTSGFASPVEKDITSPKDFEGKTYGGWGSPIEDMYLKVVMEKYNADPSLVENITVGTADFFVNTKRDVDFQWIYYGWTGVEAEVRGEDINMIYLRDIDPVFNYYAPVMISSDKVLDEQPELVEKFLKAVSRGYEFAIENPEEAADILIAATPETNPELIKASQEWLSSRYQGNAEQWGYQSEDIWTNYTDWLFESNLIENKVDNKDQMTNKFLP